MDETDCPSSKQIDFHFLQRWSYGALTRPITLTLLGSTPSAATNLPPTIRAWLYA